MLIMVTEQLHSTESEASTQISFLLTVCKKFALVSTPAIFLVRSIPPDIYLFKVNNRNTRARCEICSKLTIKTPERRRWVNAGWVSFSPLYLINNFANTIHH